MMNGLHQGITNNEALDEFMVSYRNRAWSARSWHNNKHKFCDRKHMKDFQAGYRQGYEDVAAGGNGCTPTICPESYWGWKYQSPEGQAKVSAWFEAYPLGARAAEEDGLGSWSEIRTMLPAQHVSAPAAPWTEPIPMNGAPTPVGVPMAGNSGAGNQDASGGANGQINDYSSFDFGSVARLNASDVPTAATGR
jgi:hypothetical protein